MTGDNLQLGTQAPTKINLPPYHRDWDMAVLSSLMITLQRDGSQTLEEKSRILNWQEA